MNAVGAQPGQKFSSDVRDCITRDKLALSDGGSGQHNQQHYVVPRPAAAVQHKPEQEEHGT